MQHPHLTCVTTFRLLTTFPGVVGDNHMTAILRFHRIPFRLNRGVPRLFPAATRAVRTHKYDHNEEEAQPYDAQRLHMILPAITVARNLLGPGTRAVECYFQESRTF